MTSGTSTFSRSMLQCALAIAMAAGAIGLALDGAGFSTHESTRVSGSPGSLSASIFAGQHGISAGQPRRPATPSCVMPQALVEAEISFDEVEAGHSSETSRPEENRPKPASHCSGPRHDCGGQRPSVLLANAADLCRLCRLVI